MATKQLENLTVHRLTVQPLVGDLVLTWDSVAGWPTVGDFPIRIDHPSNGTFEIVLATSVNVGLNQTTVTRAQEGTGAYGGFIVGSTGGNWLTAQMLADAFVRLDTALSQTLTGPLVVPTALGGSAAATSYGSMPLKAAETLLVATAASISWTSIPATFRTLEADWYARSDRVITVEPINARVNNDATANYQFQELRGNAGTATATETLAPTSVTVGAIPGASATAAYFGEGMLRIVHYAGTTGNKQIRANSSAWSANTTGTGFDQQHGGAWRTIATAINRLDLRPSVGPNFIVGSYFALWLKP